MAEETATAQDTPNADATSEAKAGAETEVKSDEDIFYPDDKKEATSEEKSEEAPKEDKQSEEVKDPDPEPEKKEEEAKEEKPAKEGAKDVPKEYDLKEPKDSLLTTSHIEEVKKYARKNEMSNEQAQELLNRDAHTVESFLELQVKDHEVRIDNWQKDIEADPDWGGDNFKQTVIYAKDALDQFGTSDLKDLLKNSGYGNHPEVMKVFAKIGKEIKSDNFIHKGEGPGHKQEKSMEDIFYGDPVQTN